MIDNAEVLTLANVITMIISKRFIPNEKGQGLVEYALILVLVAIVVIAALLTLGPQVGRVYSRVITVLGMESGGVVTNVSAQRTGSGGDGNDVVVNISVSTSTSVTVSDSQNASSETTTCSGSCTVTLRGVGDDAGTVTVTAEAGGGGTASYPEKP